MSIPREVYREWHPDQFSDSTIIKKANLTRDFLEYHLSKISSHSQEKDFERFCKALLEVEVCPNLLPQTGPTGGGDSKVDTETYPVAEQISESWLYGEGNKAGSERWAFAISAKADWKSKAKSDVEKIAKTVLDGRKYARIFFISNQLISDKKRAAAEDELRNLYNIDVRILGMDWLLDAVFRNEANQLIAVKALGLSENLVDEKRIGEKDYKRQRELDEIENTLKGIANLKASEIIAAARKSVILTRELEKDEQETLARLDRYNRLTKEYGTTIDQADALYDSAWTIFWWYPSVNRFYEYYQKFESIAAEEKSTYLFEKLCTLWMNLFSLTQNTEKDEIDLDNHRHIIESLFEFLVSDDNKPNTVLSARNSFQMVRLARGDSIDDVVDDYIDITQKSENSLEVSVETIAKMIQRVPIFNDAKNYDKLFDLVVARLSKEKQDAEAAKMNAIRGSQLIETDPYKALSFFSKAVLSFHNEANTDRLVHTIFLMAHLYRKIGLFWAARNYFFYVVTYCLNDYLKKGEVTSYFAAAANELKWIELMLGRVIFSAEMHGLEMIAREVYPGTIPEDKNNYDALLAISLFKTPFEKLRLLGCIPQYFDRNGLFMSSIACRYELGYYDDELLKEYNGNKEELDDFMNKWANQPAWDQIKYEPWYGFEEKSILCSRIMGCKVRVCSENDMFAIEFASTLLATLECFLGTGFYNHIISFASTFEIEIIKLPQNSFSIEIVYNRENPTHMTISISAYNDSEFQSAHEVLFEKLIEIISTVISVMLSSNEDFQRLKEMVENESVLARSEVFTDSLFYGFSTFGSNAFSYDYLMKEYDEEPIVRTQKVLLHEEGTPPSSGKSDPKKVIYGTPQGFSPQHFSNDKVYMSDVISVPLWNVSKWRGVLFMFHPNYLPVLSLIFENESGLRIFDEWIKKFGNDDADNAVGIRIIKGIDSEHPNWYRIGVGENSPFTQIRASDDCAIINPCRLNTMQPESGTNLALFEQIQAKSGRYVICPSIIRSENQQPEDHFEKRILKYAGSLKILHAYELSKDDILAAMSILPTDKPLIPAGYENCDIVGILNYNRKKLI